MLDVNECSSVILVYQLHRLRENFRLMLEVFKYRLFFEDFFLCLV